MKTIVSVIVSVVLMLLMIQPTQAQSRLGWAFRAGVDVPTGDIGYTNIKTGIGFEGMLTYRLISSLSAYGGWGWHHFTPDDNSNFDFEETGYIFGLQVMYPTGLPRLDYYLRGGGIYNHLKVENDVGDITADSGHELGWQLGGGVALDLGNRWKLMPGVRYRSLSTTTEIEGINYDTDLTYLEFSVEVARTF